MLDFDPAAHADLRAAPGVAPPPPSTAVAALCAELLADVTSLSDRVTLRILSMVPGYQATGTVVRDDLWWSVHRNLEVVLGLLAAGRHLTPEELAVRRELGARRALQQMPVEDVIRAFQVGYLELWDVLLAMAKDRGAEATAALLDGAGLIWTTMHEITSAVADAHHSEVARRDLDTRRRGVALLDALRQYPIDLPLAEQRTRDAGLDPGSAFVVAVCGGGPGRQPAPGGTVVIDEPDQTVVIAAAAGEFERAEALLAAELVRAGRPAIGVGLCRRGLPGAQRSLRDAQRLHRAAVALGVATLGFRADWFVALATQWADDLAEVVGPASALLRADPDLAATVGALLDADGRLTTAAALLHVHPNTVAYRIDGLARRTGIDARTTAGARNAALALVLARQPVDG